MVPRIRFNRGETFETFETFETVETVVARRFRGNCGVGMVVTAESAAVREFRRVGERRCGSFIGDFGDDEGKGGNGNVGMARVGGREDDIADGVHLFERLCCEGRAVEIRREEGAKEMMMMILPSVLVLLNFSAL